MSALTAGHSGALVRGGRLTVHEAGRVVRLGDGDGLDASMTVHDRRTWWRCLTGGGVALGETYMDGWWDSEDLAALLRLLSRTTDGRWPLLGRVLRTLRPMMVEPQPTATTDRRNVARHYDAGNDFFALVLDATMAYSCGIFATPTTSLEEASRAKFDTLCRKLELGPADHLLEIGSGWGGLAVHAARTYGCRVTTTTISQEQLLYVRRLVAGAGLSDRVSVLGEHFQDLRGTYSKLVSVEMIEAVDWRLYDAFFAACARLLEPGGRMALQAIVIEDHRWARARDEVDFIKKHIFPGGCLPSVAAMTESLRRATDLRIAGCETIGRNYVTTLARWRERLRSNWAAARSLGYSERFLRMWEFYLAYCEAGFAEGRLDDVQLVLAA